jgi:hypothetical protein
MIKIMSEIVKIKPEEAKAYFAQTSKYNIISMYQIQEADKEILEKGGLSLTNLELLGQDKLELEQKYINSFSANNNIDIAKVVSKQHKKYQYEVQFFLNNSNYFQQSIVETGYIYGISPFKDGRIVRSNQSFYHVNWLPIISYRFVAGGQVFYLVVGHYWGGKLFVYIPSQEIIIRYHDSSIFGAGLNEADIINNLKGYMVSFSREVKYYQNNPNRKKVVAMLGSINNIGHSIWNELTGMYHLYANNILEKLDGVIVEPYEYFAIDSLFPQLAENIIRIEDKNDIFSTILLNNYLVTRVTDVTFTKEFCQHIYEVSKKNCSPTCWQEVKEAKNHFPILWIGLRLHTRVWLSYEKELANIIKNLHSKFPNLAVVFDGYSRMPREDAWLESMIAGEKEKVQQLTNRLPTNVKIYNLVGTTTYEKVVWANAVDLYLSSPGSATAFVLWLANKPGVVHSNHVCREKWVVEQLLSRENAIMPTYIPEEYTVEEHPFHLNNNYDCDWEVIYNEIVKLLNTIQVEKTDPQ